LLLLFLKSKAEGATCYSSGDDLLATEPMRADPTGEIVMAWSLLAQKQHERANQRKHAHNRQVRRKRLTGCAPRVRFLG
jgi:hypothetical protein